LHPLAKLFEFALAEVRAGMRTIDLLSELADDNGAGGVGQIRELTEMVVGDAPRPRAL
jgi:hypothetical protein